MMGIVAGLCGIVNREIDAPCIGYEFGSGWHCASGVCSCGMVAHGHCGIVIVVVMGLKVASRAVSCWLKQQVFTDEPPAVQWGGFIVMLAVLAVNQWIIHGSCCRIAHFHRGWCCCLWFSAGEWDHHQLGWPC